MGLVQNGRFSTFCFLGNIGQENFFYEIVERKNACLGNKKKKLKKSKNCHFSKGLTHGFGPKLVIFPTFFFRQYMPGKCLLQYSRSKNRLFRPKKQGVQKVLKLTFFQSRWFWSKNGPISNSFFFWQYRPGKSLLRYSTS